jgi:hypothetical protein
VGPAAALIVTLPAMRLIFRNGQQAFGKVSCVMRVRRRCLRLQENIRREAYLLRQL